MTRSLANDKIGFALELMLFCAIVNNDEENHENETNDLDVYHKACAKYKMMYKQDFTLEHCYNVLKDYPGWLEVKMPAFFNTQLRKKSKTSETTSGSASSGFNLNDESDEVVEETQELRPMGQKWGKRDEQQQSYVELKNRELSIREAEVREAAQLKIEKLEIQHQTLELAERDNRPVFAPNTTREAARDEDENQ
nr:hypothetical protein [Tanacetum cinerariifolium]